MTLTHLTTANVRRAQRCADYLTGCTCPVDFEDLALPLFDSAYRFALRLAKCEADAQDLIQETYLKAFRSFDHFEPGSNFRAWIFRILKNTYLTSLSQAHQRWVICEFCDELLTEAPSPYPDPLSLLLWQDRGEAFEAAVQQLPAILYEVLLLCDLEEASYREAAQILSVPLGTVMSRLWRARRAIRAALSEAGHD
jgi:RNA polymerase sigma-70 factor, ECF subfamily